jgi:hypothetical protein
MELIAIVLCILIIAVIAYAHQRSVTGVKTDLENARAEIDADLQAIRNHLGLPPSTAGTPGDRA